jgi:hypothetical protein
MMPTKYSWKKIERFLYDIKKYLFMPDQEWPPAKFGILLLMWRSKKQQTFL